MNNRISQGNAGVVKPGKKKCMERPANATRVETIARFLVNRIRRSFMNMNYRRRSFIAK